MNERIRLLAEQAFFDESTSRPSTKMYTFSDHKMEKFAELMVVEFTETVKQTANELAESGFRQGQSEEEVMKTVNGALAVLKGIVAKFGVEE